MPNIFRLLQEEIGKKTHGNPYTLNAGSARELENLQCFRDNVYNKPRGRKAFGTGLPTGDILNFIGYNKRLYCHIDTGTTNKLYYNSNPSTEAFTKVEDANATPGDEFNPPSSDYLLRSVSFNSGHYFVSSKGVYKQDVLGGKARLCGVPKGLGMELKIISSTNWLPTSKRVAYRICWTYRDANNNVVRGAPSDRYEAYNESGTDKAVRLFFFIPDQIRGFISSIATSYTYEIYRSSYTDVAVTPPEDFQLVFTDSLTAAQVTQGLVTIDDILIDAFKGAYLYTNTTIEGIENSNYQPPKANYITTYREYMLIAGIKSVERLYFNLVGTSGITPGTSTLTLSSGTNTLTSTAMRYDINIGNGITGAANNGAGLIRITTAQPHSLATNDYITISGIVGTVEGNGSWKVTYVGANSFDLQGSTFINAWISGGTINNVENRGTSVTGSANNGSGKVRYAFSKIHGLTTDDYILISGDTGTPLANGVYKVLFVSDTTHIDIDVAFVLTGTPTIDLYEDIGTTPRFFVDTTYDHTPSEKIDLTARSISKIYTLASSLYEGYYISGVQDPVGKLLIEASDVGTAAFSLTTNSTSAGSMFSPSIPTSGTDYISTSDNYQNAFMWSKAGEECFPLGNIKFVGNAGDPILAIIGLRDEVFIIKEEDGISRMVGDVPANWVVSEFDGTIKCSQPNTIAKGENAICMNTESGYVKIQGAGIEPIGQDNLYKDLKGSIGVNFKTNGYGWFYETERNYYVSTPQTATDTDNTICRVYNSWNKGWWDLITGVYTNDTLIRCGIVIGDTMFTAPLTGNGILIERKDFAVTDYQTPSVSNIITGIDSVLNRVSFATPVNIPVGSNLLQGTYSKIITNKISNIVYEFSDVNDLVAGVCTFEVGIVSKVKYQMLNCSSPETDKQFGNVTILLDNDETDVSDFCIKTSTDTESEEKESHYNGGDIERWGDEWGIVWGGVGTTDKWETLTPSGRGTYLNLEVCHQIPKEQLAICGLGFVYETISDRGRIE